MPQKRTREQKIHTQQKREMYKWKPQEGKIAQPVSVSVPVVTSRVAQESQFEKEERMAIMKDLRKSVLVSSLMIAILLLLKTQMS